MKKTLVSVLVLTALSIGACKKETTPEPTAQPLANSTVTNYDRLVMEPVDIGFRTSITYGGSVIIPQVISCDSQKDSVLLFDISSNPLKTNVEFTIVINNQSSFGYNMYAVPVGEDECLFFNGTHEGSTFIMTAFGGFEDTIVNTIY